MQTILNDIELDVAELRCLLQALSAGHDPKLAAVAGRNINRMKQKLDTLQHLLEQPATPSKTGTTTPPPHDESGSRTPLPAQEENASPTPCPDIATGNVPTVAPQAEPTATLAERIRPAQDLRHALSLNDSFRFAREWFDGDTARLNHLLRLLGDRPTWNEARVLLATEIQAAEDDPALADFEELLKKYFAS